MSGRRTNVAPRHCQYHGPTAPLAGCDSFAAWLLHPGNRQQIRRSHWVCETHAREALMAEDGSSVYDLDGDIEQALGVDGELEEAS